MAELPLRIEIPVSSEESLFSWFDRLSANDIVRLEIEQLEHPNAMWSNAKGRLPIEHVTGSAALQAAHAARQQRVVIRDEVLGELVLDRRFNWFETELSFRGSDCNVSIRQSGASEDRGRDLRDIARARTILARVDDEWPAIENAIVHEMLPLYNDDWREDGPVLTAQQFLAEILLQSIEVGDSRVTLYFNDGGLFLEHLIEVRLSPTVAVTEVLLAG